MPGEGASSPVVLGDRIFLTSALENGTRRVLQALDRRTGATLWTLETKDPDPERTSALAGHAASTAAVDASRAVAFFGNAGVVCADLEGRLLWRRSLGPFKSELGIASSPILHKDLVLIVGDHDGASFLVALDAKSGEERWRTSRPGLERSWSTPVVVDGRLIVSAQDELRAYDPLDGRLLWRVEGMSGWVAPSPVAGAGRIYATSGRDGPTLAVKPDGTVAWREERGGPYVCSPLYLDSLLYVPDEQGRLSCRDAATGALVYRERLGGKFTASPVAGDGKLYLANEEGVVFVVKAGRRFERLAENALGEEILASPAIARRELFIRTRTRLYCVR